MHKETLPRSPLMIMSPIRAFISTCKQKLIFTTFKLKGRPVFYRLRLQNAAVMAGLTAWRGGGGEGLPSLPYAGQSTSYKLHNLNFFFNILVQPEPALKGRLRLRQKRGGSSGSGSSTLVIDLLLVLVSYLANCF